MFASETFFFLFSPHTCICNLKLIYNSPPRRIHSRCENEQEQNENEVYFRDGFGVMLDFRPFSDPHSDAAVR